MKLALHIYFNPSHIAIPAQSGHCFRRTEGSAQNTSSWGQLIQCTLHGRKPRVMAESETPHFLWMLPVTLLACTLEHLLLAKHSRQLHHHNSCGVWWVPSNRKLAIVNITQSSTNDDVYCTHTYHKKISHWPTHFVAFDTDTIRSSTAICVSSLGKAGVFPRSDNIGNKLWCQIKKIEIKDNNKRNKKMLRNTHLFYGVIL